MVASGHACVRFLAAQPPNVAKAHEAAESIVRDGKEAGEVVRRIRALFKRAPVEKVMLNLNEVIGEVLRILSGETARRQVAVETDLKPDLPLVPGDRIQLQQVVLNLLLNGIEAMDPVQDRSRKLIVRSNRQSPTPYWWRSGTTALVLRIPIASSMPSSPPSRREWAWV